MDRRKRFGFGFCRLLSSVEQYDAVPQLREIFELNQADYLNRSDTRSQDPSIERGDVARTVTFAGRGGLSPTAPYAKLLKKVEAPSGFEPEMEVLQTSAL